MLEDLEFAMTHRGAVDKEAFACEFLIVPFLKEAWKRHPDLNLFSHLSIQVNDLTAIPDYVGIGEDTNRLERSNNTASSRRRSQG